MSEERFLKILLTPHVSEKASRAEMTSHYVFKVLKDANKSEIKKAVEQLFSVTVEAVRVINVRGKQTRFGRMLGRRKDWKKAYVKLKQGQTIDLAGAKA